MENNTTANLENLKNKIEEIWNNKENISSSTEGTERNSIEECLSLLDSGISNSHILAPVPLDTSEINK